MSAVRVVTDSACDLPASLLSTHEIEVVPHTVRVGGEEITDRAEDREELWAKIAAAPVPVETAAPSAARFTSCFDSVANTGAAGILVLTMSAELSASHQAAVLAGERFGGSVAVRVVDSRTVSMALGLQVLDAARRARQGATLDDLAMPQQSTGLAIAFDSLDTLRRQGQVGRVQHRIAGWLEHRPIVTVEDGTLVGAGRWKGRDDAREALAHTVEPLAARLVDLAVVAAQPGDAEDLNSRLTHLVPPERLHRSTLGPVVGAFTGPGAIGVAWSTV
jgi:DegV family protein with EDD domain